ncbi:isocitrate lyase/phosphoenolpyruvate mutase family protein [Caulobacter sp. 17J65-9]|uniref:isocitrate lyase/PEP mutase family protein n=1 Tax=Caulobacter sp. 17J65-9 TaxID=2709382 RepID=UPI0013C7A09A|nr:isocitrate lyase/phosphoenolpyruvate mutase family protein [Caulobacter sp. 17J65-9]NEX93684.1 isocitrate lyase/phosphoenolpyruvate mutase family protein [Caulobacter sp. 17J65-9]
MGHDASFRGMHVGPGVLVLANVWDVGSARLIDSLGPRAIGTTSAGVAWAHGYPDRNALPPRLLVETVERIARVVAVPLTVDVEGGYSDDLDAVEATVAGVVAAGAVGINIEDGVGAPDLLCAKIERARRAAARLGVDLFVNARTDVYLRPGAGGEESVAEVLARADRYRAAGADGLFVLGITAADEIRAVVAGAGLPINVLARAGLPPTAELAALGVRRLSAGSAVPEAVWERARTLAADFLRDGRSEPLSEAPGAYAALNRLMVRDAEGGPLVE